ncbi:MAG TPA: acetyltransferase [Bryobacteraceae bacterium]|nr:acetyltransferase [Bryobacteraceae bacterium]
MKRCLVVGAAGCGREVLSWALHMKQQDWHIEGFLDADPLALEGTDFPYRVLGDPAGWTPAGDEVFIAGLGDPETRMRVCLGLKERGAEFVTVLHPTVVLALNVTIGEGCVLAPNVVVSANARLGKFILVNIAASIGHDSDTGDGSTVSCHCDVMGHVKIGRGCFLGSHASVLPGKRVGDGAIVGAGSAVTRHVAERTTVLGVPAQVLMPSRPEKSPADILLGIKNG